MFCTSISLVLVWPEIRVLVKCDVKLFLKIYLSIINDSYTDLILLYAPYGKFYDFFKIYIRQ